jgi:hypothetical protein
MTEETLTGHLGTSVTTNICRVCQLFWFDSGESLRLSPGGVLKLFGIIGEHKLTATGSPGTTGDDHRVACPRCDIRLLLTHDQQRNTKFQYLRCPKGHGRLTTFVNFLREKDFIKPLSAQEIEELRQRVQTINCSNCGAAINLATETVCAHCGSPLSMLDLKQAGALVAALRTADQPRGIDPSLPLRLEEARREVEAAFASMEHRSDWWTDVAGRGLVSAGVSALADFLKRSVQA